MEDHVKKKNKDWLTWSQYNVSDLRHGFCEIAPKSNFVCNSLVQRRHHYHLVNKKHVLPFGHLELKQQSLTQYFGYHYANTKSLQQDLKK